ncbi:MAG: monofunctional biosynthetic peptidoglycan transglycosylase [Pseudomonadota bacterium]
MKSDAAEEDLPRPRRRQGLFARAARLVLWAVGLVLLWVALLGLVNPPITYLMVREYRAHGTLEREWQSLEALGSEIALAVAAAEDARFCEHVGFDLAAIQEALGEEGRRRGASTISQQVAKNVFLWPDRSWLRKGLEAGFTVLIELFWSKRRIMEVYLNVAETGTGTFGAEAAARQAFGVGAGELSPRQAARIAVTLPNPKARSAASPTDFLRRRAAAVMDGAATLRATGRADCFL